MAGFDLQVILDTGLGAGPSVGVSIRPWGDDDIVSTIPRHRRVNHIAGRPQRYVHVDLFEHALSRLSVRPVSPETGALVTRAMIVFIGERGFGPTPTISYDLPGTDITIGPECSGHWSIVYKDAGPGAWQGAVSLPFFVRRLGT